MLLYICITCWLFRIRCQLFWKWAGNIGWNYVLFYKDKIEQFDDWGEGYRLVMSWIANPEPKCDTLDFQLWAESWYFDLPPLAEAQILWFATVSWSTNLIYCHQGLKYGYYSFLPQAKA